MSKSLQDQLLKAGLANRKQAVSARKAENEAEKLTFRNQYLKELSDFAAANNLGGNGASTNDPGAPAAAKQAAPVTKPATPAIQINE